MSPETFKKLKRQAMYYAYQKGFSHLAEDFASHYLMLCLSKRELEYQKNDIKLKWAWAGFIRDTFGDRTTDKGRAQSKGMRREVNFDSLYSQDSILDLREEEMDFSKLPFDQMTHLKPRELRLLKLLCVDRLRLWEAAKEMGLSEEWAYQLLRHVLKKSGRFFTSPASLDARKRSNEKGRIE